MSSGSTWINHFPDNVMWSNAALIAKGMAPWGAVAIDEIDRIGEKLKQRANEPDAWWQEWADMASKIEKRADDAAADGRQFTAGNYYIRAGNYYFTSERFIPPGDLKFDLYRKALRCFHAGFDRRYPDIERVEVPYEGASLPAYFKKAAGVSGQAPTVVLFDGLDNCKEMSVVFAGVEFAMRGFHTLAIDGPGQGEALRLRKIHSRYDYEVAGTAAYNYISQRPEVDPKKVAVMGYSFGGYLAPRIAAFEKRYAACVALGASQWDRAAEQIRRRRIIEATPEKCTQSNFQWAWVVGAKNLDWDESIEMAKRFTLVDCAKQITCAFLVTHGGNDRQTPPSVAEKLYAEVGSKNKTIKIFTTDEGGAEHCHVDNRQVGIDFVADWLTATFS